MYGHMIKAEIKHVTCMETGSVAKNLKQRERERD